MNASRAPGPWIARIGATLLAVGFAARLHMPANMRPEIEVLGIALLLLGAGLVLVDAALRGRAPAAAWTLLLPWLLAIPLFRGGEAAPKIALDFAAASIAGFAARELASRSGPSAVRRALVAAVLPLALFGIAQTLWLNADARVVAERIGHVLTTTAQGRAFLDSWRAQATFLSPNAFAGLLLLVGPMAAGAAFQSGGRGRGAAALGTAVLAAAFLAAGSAGAALVLPMAVVLAFASWTAPGTRARKAALAAGAILGAGCAGLVVAAAKSVGATGKLATLRERLDYADAGFRMLAGGSLFGRGFGATATDVARYVRPGDASSRSLHNWWLEGSVEAGVFFIPVAAALVLLGFRALRAAPQAEVAAETPRGIGLALAAGAFFAGLVHPFVVYFPTTFKFDSLFDAALAAAAAFGAWSLLGRVDWSGSGVRRGAAVGVVAFLLHGLVDFDVQVAGVAAAFGLAAGASPAPSSMPASRAAVRAAGALGLLALLLPAVLLATRQSP